MTFDLFGFARRALPAIALASLTFGCGGAESEPPAIQAAKAFVTEGARDPDSVTFRGLKAMVSGSVCGEFNGRNGFGGMTGFQRFIYHPHPRPLAVYQGEFRFEESWSVTCEGAAEQVRARRQS